MIQVKDIKKVYNGVIVVNFFNVFYLYHIIYF